MLFSIHHLPLSVLDTTKLKGVLLILNIMYKHYNDICTKLNSEYFSNWNLPTIGMDTNGLLMGSVELHGCKKWQKDHVRTPSLYGITF